ncbi:MAG TPA: hypothetical protein VGI75_03770, partial [Pirellulales bacterium]
ILNTKLSFVRQSEELSRKLYDKKDDSPLRWIRPSGGGYRMRSFQHAAAAEPSPVPESVQP